MTSSMRTCPSLSMAVLPDAASHKAARSATPSIATSLHARPPVPLPSLREAVSSEAIAPWIMVS
eukprot:3932785-Pleurochrysis_carterae.AAC.10